MARPSKADGFTIAALEQLLASRHNKLRELQKERTKVQKKLDEIDHKIFSLNGGRGRMGSSGGGGGGGRAQNSMSLVATLESVLGGSGKPMPVGDIVEKVQAAGYRSNSANFRALVNQTLIKEKRFSSAGRGLYQLKK